MFPYTQKQSDVPVLNGVLPLRWIVAGPSGAGKGVVLSNICTRLLTHHGKSCFERIYVFSPTAVLDKSTWGPVNTFMEAKMDVDLDKEPAFFEEFEEETINKIRTRHSSVGRRQKEAGMKSLYGNFDNC